MQCTEAALNKDFWHNLCAANTSLSRNIVAEIGQTIATYAVNLSIERQQLREFIRELTQALERMAQENTSATSIARQFERNAQDMEKLLAEQDTKLQKHEQQRELYMYNKEHTTMLARTVLRDLGVLARNDVDLNMVTVIQDVAHVVRQRTIDECEKEAIRTVTAAYARSTSASPVSMTDSIFDSPKPEVLLITSPVTPSVPKENNKRKWDEFCTSEELSSSSSDTCSQASTVPASPAGSRVLQQWIDQQWVDMEPQLF